MAKLNLRRTRYSYHHDNRPNKEVDDKIGELLKGLGTIQEICNLVQRNVRPDQAQKVLDELKERYGWK